MVLLAPSMSNLADYFKERVKAHQIYLLKQAKEDVAKKEQVKKEQLTEKDRWNQARKEALDKLENLNLANSFLTTEQYMRQVLGNPPDSQFYFQELPTPQESWKQYLQSAANNTLGGNVETDPRKYRGLYLRVAAGTAVQRETYGEYNDSRHVRYPRVALMALSLYQPGAMFLGIGATYHNELHSSRKGMVYPVTTGYFESREDESSHTLRDINFWSREKIEDTCKRLASI